MDKTLRDVEATANDGMMMVSLMEKWWKEEMCMFLDKLCAQGFALHVKDNLIDAPLSWTLRGEGLMMMAARSS